jgi:hypothetical protein
MYKIDATLLGDHFFPNRKIVLMAAVESVDLGVRLIETGNALPLHRDQRLTVSWSRSWLDAQSAVYVGLSEEECVPSIQNMVSLHGESVSEAVPNVEHAHVLIRATCTCALQGNGGENIELLFVTFRKSAGPGAIYANDVLLKGFKVRAGWEQRNISVNSDLFMPGMVAFQGICLDKDVVLVSEAVPVAVLRGKTWPAVSVAIHARMHASDNFSLIQRADDGTVTVPLSAEMRFDYVTRFDKEDGVSGIAPENAFALP